jgi:hypothetical protein
MIHRFCIPPPRRAAQESASFLKKRSKKLLLLGAVATARPAPAEQKFFGYFFSKK